jgi:phosphoribosyl 1,2-cyclic phosphate phosphodiesterase
VIPCYGSAETLEQIRSAFGYIFETGTQEGGGKPRIELRPIEADDLTDGAFDLFGAPIVPVPVLHGSLEVWGFRLGKFAYITDCSHIPESSFALLKGVEVLILGALRLRPHPTHFSFAEAFEGAARIGAGRTILTHINHEIDHGAPGVELPPGVEIGHDGLVLELSS